MGGVSVVFAGGADFVFFFCKTDANVGTDEPLYVVACVRCDQTVFDEADGYSQVGVDDQLAFAGIAVHAAVDILVFLGCAE